MSEKYTEETFKKHLEEEHKQSPLSTYLREIVYGANDGIVTTFAVVAGFTGAQIASPMAGKPYFLVLLFGFANLFADAASMGLGNFVSARSAKDAYAQEKRKEMYEIQNSTSMEKEETMHLLQQKGFSEEDAHALTKIYMKNEPYWLDFMMRYELELPNPEGENPWLTAGATLIAFVTFGFIPLIPYVFNVSPDKIFLSSSALVAIALIVVGFLRWKVTRESVIRSIGETVLVGGIAAGIAYVVGTFFRI